MNFYFLLQYVIFTAMKKLTLFSAILFTFTLLSCDLGMINPNIEIPAARLELSKEKPSSEIILSWHKCKDSTGYEIIKSYERDGEVQREPSLYLSEEISSYIDSACEPDTEYTYTVIAKYFSTKGFFYGRVFGDLHEEASAPQKIRTSKNPLFILDYPTKLEIKADDNKTNALKLTWTACKGADSYKIYKKDSSSGLYEVLENVAGLEADISGQCSHTVKNLFNELEYSFKLQALGPGKTSSLLSKAISGKVPKAENTKIETALSLENNCEEHFYTAEENLWFIIRPSEGIITIKNDAAIGTGLMLFNLEGQLLNGNPSYELKEEYVWSIKDDIKDGEQYLLRICNPGFITIQVQ